MGWNNSAAKRQKCKAYCIGIYIRLPGRKNGRFRVKVFDSYNLEWLEYVIDCRRGGEMQKQYDIVEGGVANDNVIDTVEDYENGIITAEQALGQLRYKRVNHQICILNQEIIDKFLTFKNSEIVPE